jgi:hypothetical protein
MAVHPRPVAAVGLVAHRSNDSWVLAGWGWTGAKMKLTKFLSSEAAGQVAIVGSVAGALAGAAGLLVGVLSTQNG